MITLREIDESNWRECIGLSVKDDQKRFVAPNENALALAFAHKEMKPRAIYSDEQMVGLIMFARDPDDGVYYINRLMIDEKYQGNGFGKQALNLLLEQLRDKGVNYVDILHKPDNHSAIRIYRELGFIETDQKVGDDAVSTCHFQTGDSELPSVREDVNSSYLSSISRQFEYYKLLGEKTFAQVTDEQLFIQFNEDSNSIAVIVKHLWGNMMSRWTDFLTSDGEKDWRKRDNEFESDIRTREEILSKWNEGWNCLFDSLNKLNSDDLEKIVYIRNQGHTVVEAINRQLAHCAYHTGQIVYIGKMLCGESWHSLSIPKGGSADYNESITSAGKRIEHFTDSILKGNERKDS